MKIKKELYICLLIFGLVLLCAGGCFFGEGVYHARSLKYDFESYMIPVLLIMIGGGLTIFTATRLALIRMVLRHPDTVRGIEIDAKDERKIHINHMARSRAFTAMEFVYAAIILMVILLREQWLISLLLLIGGYAVGWLIYFIYLRKLAKEM